MYNKILPFVTRPSRYINSEWNSIHKSRSDIKICFCFPDMYEVAMSNLGIEILYHTVNSRDDAVAERCYCPATDMEQLLRKEKIPLLSLESKTPLKDFDIVGFSLQHELCYTNVLTMLDLADIPIYSPDRTETSPLVIAGGPACSNPEPASDFFDIMVIGEGEDIINEIITTVKQSKKCSRKDLLLNLAQIEGVYVPQFYEVEYNTDGRISKITRNFQNIPEKIKKRTVDLKTAFYPFSPIVPYAQIVHDRLNIEISRGCRNNCRFCQASNLYRPWRERPVEKILEILENSVQNTGYEELALTSFSVSSYSKIEELIKSVNRYCLDNNIFLSVPSLRCDMKSARILPYLIYPHRSNITFAIETGTERLRKVINKEIPDEDIISTVLYTRKLGWKLIKLYFMIGLPTEKEEDISAIVELTGKIQQSVPGMKFNITISPFVPKSHTPFQWSKMESMDSLIDKAKLLKHKLHGEVKVHDIRTSLLEAVFSMGDRKLGSVIYTAWNNGCKFDMWKEKFNFDLWLEAFKKCGIDYEFYLRGYDSDDMLPWEHINFGPEKKVLYEEYAKIGTATIYGHTLEKTPVPDLPPVPISGNYKNLEGQFLYRLLFSRKNDLRFLSHLEQIELIRRCIKRTGLPVSYTSGFHPQMKISFGTAISVGYESDTEYVDLELYKKTGIEQVAKEIIKQLPQNFSLLKVEQIPRFLPSLDSSFSKVTYKIDLSCLKEQVDWGNICKTVQNFLSQKEVIITKIKGDRTESIDVIPLIQKLEPKDNYRIELSLKFGPKKNVKPEKIIQSLLNLDESSTKLLKITRTTLLS